MIYEINGISETGGIGSLQYNWRSILIPWEVGGVPIVHTTMSRALDEILNKLTTQRRVQSKLQRLQVHAGDRPGGGSSLWPLPMKQARYKAELLKALSLFTAQTTSQDTRKLEVQDVSTFRLN